MLITGFVQLKTMAKKRSLITNHDVTQITRNIENQLKKEEKT